jgi:predicted Zn-dependent protease
MFYSDAEAFASLAEIQAKMNKVSEAKENILKALSLEPENKKLQELKLKLGF